MKGENKVTEHEVIHAINFIRKFKTETNKIETKAAQKGYPKKCYDTISSFSNKYGWIIIFGIDEEDDFKITGVYDVKDLQRKIAALCSDSMEPAVRPEFLPLEIDGKKILAGRIEEIMQSRKPCYYKPKGLNKGSNTRIGDRDELMTDYETYALQSYNDGVKEDLRPNKRACLEDLNKGELKKYIVKIKEEKHNFSKSIDDKILKLPGIIDNADGAIYPTIAGTLIFCDYPQAFYPQLFIACAVIPGTELGMTGEMGERFEDNKRIEGSIEQMLDGALSFLRKNMKTKIIIDSKTGKRKNIPEYPMLALREAIANALIHRDYSIQTENAYIQVYMYDDRIVIQNPGALYGINKLEKLGTDTIMEARNSTLVKILEEKGAVIENRHTGIPTMRREMKKMNLPEPEFLEERGSFKVIFRNSNTEQDWKTKIKNEAPKLNSGAQKENSGAQNSNYYELLIKYCKVPKTAKEISRYLGYKSKSYVREKIIKPLLKSDILEYTNKNTVNARNQKYQTKVSLKNCKF